MRVCSREGCERRHSSRGYCKLHYDRLMRTGTTEKNVIPAEERFWAKVDKSGKCWLWTASLSNKGYGQFGVAYGSPIVLAHRYSYELANGPIASGMEIDHICHATACVRPGHLREATRKQNIENHSGAQKNSISGIRGAHYHARTGRWQAAIMHDGHRMHLGYFATAEEAGTVAAAARRDYHTFNDMDRQAGE